MNIDKMIDMLLISLSKKHNIFYMEMRTYKGTKTYKNYNVKIDKDKKEFRSKKDLLVYLTNI